MAEYPGEIYLGNSFNVRAGSAAEPLVVEHPTTGVVGAFTEQVIRCYLAEDAGGVPGTTPIHATLDIAALTEDDLLPGVYRGGFEGGDLATHLASFVDTTIWVVYHADGLYLRAENLVVRNPRTGK